MLKSNGQTDVLSEVERAIVDAKNVKNVLNYVQMTFQCVYSGRLELHTVILDV